MRGRTIVLVSHHVQLCAPGASYVVALDNGRVQFQGGQTEFMTSDVLNTLSQSKATNPADATEETQVVTIEEVVDKDEQVIGPSNTSNNTENGENGEGGSSESSSTVAPTATNDEGSTANGADAKVEKKAPRKLIEEEKRAVGRIGKDIWLTYIKASGSAVYWSLFSVSLIVAAASPVLENWWLK